MGRDIEFNEKEKEVISKLKEAIERYLDSRSASLIDESEIYITKHPNDDSRVLVEIIMPRMSLDRFRELDTDTSNFIEEYASDNNIPIHLDISQSTDFAQSIDELEYGEDININDVEYEDETDEYDDYKNNHMNIYSEDDILKDIEDDDDDYYENDDDDYYDSDYRPDAKDLVDFFSTENSYSRLSDNEMRRSMGAYDDY